MSTFDSLVADLTRDIHRAQPKDALQFCANWFQSRLEEQRTRTRDALTTHRGLSSIQEQLPTDFYVDVVPRNATPTPVSPFSNVASLRRPSSFHPFTYSPFGTLNVPGNALLSSIDHNGASNGMGPPTFMLDGRELPPTSPLSTDPSNSFARYDTTSTPTMTNSLSLGPSDYLQAPSATILARRSSVSAEPIAVDSGHDDPLPIYPKTPDQLRRIKASIANNFIFRDLDEEQETGVLNAMQERRVNKDEVVIRQGDVGEYFYVVESGLFYCYIHPEPLPPTWLTENPSSTMSSQADKFLQPGYHPVYGRKVMECKPGNSFGELALMYGHPRAATVQAIEPSTVWALDRITFRTIILKAAHRRRTMYEHFLSTVPLLSSLEPGERSKIADALVSRVYPDGEAVVSQGEMGDTFFFVEEGEAIVTKKHRCEEDDWREITVGHLKKGDYFGELSLLRLAPRAATVSAVHRADQSQPKLKVAALDAPSFTRLLGPLREIMERTAGESYGLMTRTSR
ncbi:cyclic nucleotide-binding-like protein [Boletus edulis]|uniref:cAMP-dependent protein kinase regulatory subunit n=1 Tax=Boletus edulis BED1 TaxID=1328754 RepID=A0AAD4C5V7_BOLED|nr:cyclic nucleotide-binding-like protein [Boletus edulis]KAF8450360.1 cyclic nucleotide-binding-like protein [Boletus edulis BED1]